MFDIKNDENEGVAYFEETPLYGTTEARRNWLRMTAKANLGSEFLDYVTTLIREIDPDALLTPSQLIVKHMIKIGAVNDDPERAIDFVAQMAKFNLLPLVCVGTDLYGDEVYRVSYQNVDTPYTGYSNFQQKDFNLEEVI